MLRGSSIKFGGSSGREGPSIMTENSPPSTNRLAFLPLASAAMIGELTLIRSPSDVAITSSVGAKTRRLGVIQRKNRNRTASFSLENVTRRSSATAIATRAAGLSTSTMTTESSARACRV